MFVIAITHADSTSRNPRSLSEGGRQQALLAARRVRELVGKKTSLAAVCSSAAARCLETAIIVSRELGETTREDGTYEGRFRVVEQLSEVRGTPAKTPDDLIEALRPFEEQDLGQNKAVLLTTHGDLANMLGHSSTFTEQAASGGWFEYRPVIAGFEHSAGRPPVVKFCEALHGGTWIPCLAIQ